MKTKLSLLLFLGISIAYAQQPYYNNVDLTKTGIELREELTTKITQTHINFLSYTPGIWEASRITDEDPTNENNVILIYGFENGSDGDVTNDISRGKNNNGGDNGEWNREHTYARSLGTPNLGLEGPGADAHHLRPSDVQRNSNRSNRKFADGSGNSGITAQGNWYPGDEWKGDIARMMLYMYVRYGARALPSNVVVGNTNSIDSNMIDLLLEWNAEDPVSLIEINRNNYHNTTEMYAQGNRNPFIDNPNLATQIWGGPAAEDRWNAVQSDTEAPTAPTSLILNNTGINTLMVSWNTSSDNIEVVRYDVYIDGVYVTSAQNTSLSITNLNANTSYNIQVFAEDLAGNVSEGSNILNATTLPPDMEAPTVPANLMITGQTSTTLDISWTDSTDNVEVTEYDIYVDGIFNSSVSNTNSTITGLSPETTYAISVLAKDAEGNTSAQTAPVNGITAMISVGGESDLFISEYVEGSGFNKALEIANFTDQTVDLSNYSIRRQGNGAGAWGTALNLSGTLTIGDVFVIINTSTTDPTLIAEADLSINNIEPLTFNGNDPIGLFNNGVLIDIVGVFDGGSANFAKDVTLRRKPTITIPNPSFNLSEEWDSFSRNTVDDIGSHTVATLEISDFIKDSFSIYPNPSVDRNITINIKDNTNNELNIYDITGKRILTKKNVKKTIQLSDLPPGMLLLEVISSKKSSIKKIIIR